MVRAWYMTGSNEDQREPHMPDPLVFVSLEELKEKTGAEYLKFNADNWEMDEDYAELKRARGYTFEDVCEISRETLPNYDEKLKNFFTEHIHSDEEIRFVVKGSGYFDLRDINDKWIRVEVTKNDLLIVPAGIYHRFTLDRNNYIKVKRLFVGEPVWTPINRPGADDHPARKSYLLSIANIENFMVVQFSLILAYDMAELEKDFHPASPHDSKDHYQHKSEPALLPSINNCY